MLVLSRIMGSCQIIIMPPGRNFFSESQAENTVRVVPLLFRGGEVLLPFWKNRGEVPWGIYLHSSYVKVKASKTQTILKRRECHRQTSYSSYYLDTSKVIGIQISYKGSSLVFRRIFPLKLFTIKRLERCNKRH